MKVYRMMAALLSAAMLTAAPAVYAEDAQTPAAQATDGQTQTAASADESSAEKNTNQAESGKQAGIEKQSGSEKQSEKAEASGKTELPETNGLPAAGSSAEGTRPSYKASDYVKIGDDQYKTMTIRVYPPADSSAEAQADYKKKLDTDIMTRLYSLYPVDKYPQELLDYVTGSLSSTYKQYADMYGMDFGTFLSTYLGMDEKAFSDAVKKAAETTLKQELLLSAIAEKEQITVSDEDYQKGLSDYASRYGYASTDALLADFDEATIRVSLLMDKTLDFLETANHVEQIVETESESAQTESEAAQTTETAGQETTAQTAAAAGKETTAQTAAAAGQDTTAQTAGGQ
ncbi:hypothetical protein [Porcincola intestinalis]|uniref:hypothetical protein n=1 Tax=Porcincola intestinalis TaxID=2606632 RepID=UPI0023F0647C|nr:hypothetical protein [Porcincola intestinalis]MCI6767297.1 hypothetical protein [Lachnospiraceae bacterium]MDD7059771.1 hypothetical protein [Porcincola intestinalis]MDY5283015.1 hypothetical protein [Porcincola intestinalis]